MIQAYFTDSVTIITPTLDTFGDESSTAETTVRARITEKNQIVRDFKGAEVISQAEIMIANRTLDNKARIKYNGIEHILLNTRVEKDFQSRFITLMVA